MGRLTKISKIVVASIGSVLLVIVLLPELFPGFVSDKIKSWASASISTELKFSGVRLSFIKHFPSLTLSLYDFSVMGSAPFAKDTLISGKELAFGFDLSSIFKSKLSVDEFYLDQSHIRVLADAAGHANYNIYKGSNEKTTTSKESNASLQIEKIIISNSRLVYSDQSLPMMIEANGFNYTGKGDLSKSLFDLQSKLRIEDCNFSYSGESYVENKTVKANLITSVNTNTLSLRFQKNDLLINSLPVDFKGFFDFTKDGYAMDFNFTSGNTGLHDVFTILPPAYLKWLNDVDMKGNAELTASLSGNYIAATNTNPNLHVSVHVSDGYVKHHAASAAVSNINTKASINMPGLNMDSLRIDLDTFYLGLDKNYLQASLHTKGYLPLQVNGRLHSQMDLQNLDKAVGLQSLDLKGNINTSFWIDGIYNTSIVKKLHSQDTIISSIPRFAGSSIISNGYVKFDSLPAAIQNIHADIKAAAPTNQYSDIRLDINNLSAQILKSYVKGYCHLVNSSNTSIDASIQSDINLADISKAIPLKTFTLNGKMQADVQAKGTCNAAKKMLPALTAHVQVSDASIASSYYPHPVTNINMHLSATDKDAGLRSMNISVSPLEFKFEDEPFTINASCNNFEDIHYQARADGRLNIGNIYKVFSQKGMDASGFIEAHLALQGKQSDAMHGRLDKLSNKGSLYLKNMSFSYDEYPHPFYVNSGLLKFDNDKIWLTNTHASYAGNRFSMNGYFENIVNYCLQKGALKGQLSVATNQLRVNDFMVFADTSTATTQAAGVVLVPGNLSVVLQANAKHVWYDDLDIQNLQGTVRIDSAKIYLHEAKLRIADALVSADGFYTSLRPDKAYFDFHFAADSFDIAKAYRQVKMFRDMASSASKTKGIVSLNYHLQGNLNDQMMPVYPSLKGGGVLKLENISVNGLRLFTEMSKTTGRDSINNPNLKAVNIKTSIANNIITIERVKMKVFGFRPRFEGQTSFDGRLHLKARLGLPPLGIIGIPMTITGTSAKPIIKLRKSEEQSLEAEKPEEDQ